MIQFALKFAPGHGVYWMIGILLFIVIYKWRNILNALFYILVFPFVLPYVIIHDVVMSIKRERKKRKLEND